MPVDSHICGSGVEVTRLYEADATVVQDRTIAGIGKVLGRYVYPILTTIGGHVDETIIATRPNCTRLHRRLRDSKHRRIVFGAGVVLRNGSARRLFGALVVAREIGANLLPVITAITGLQNHLRSVIDDVGIVRRDHDWRSPLKAVFEIHIAVTHGI